MREINFKTYHKKTLAREFGSLKSLADGDHSNIKYDEYYWCESTGLKDKNGKEIYEGDIVKMPVLEREGFINIFGEVRMKDGCFEIFEKVYEGKPLFHGHYLEFEIIGNIYENPELLEVR